MASSRRFRFSVVAEHARTRQEWIDRARRAEDLGYSTFLVPDHTWIDIDPVVGMMAAAEQTSSIRIGSHVFCNDFRSPALLAKQVASIDLFSNGRVQLGVGCGYFEGDYKQASIAFEPVGVRVSRLEEAVQLIKRFFHDDVLNFSGKYYQVEGLEAKPKPVQPSIPLYIGGAGKRMLSLAAREADIVGLGAKFVGPAAFAFDLRSTLPAGSAEKLEWIRQAAGERFEQIELSTTAVFSVVTMNSAQGMGVVQQLAGRSGFSPEEVLSSMLVLVGSPDQIVEKLLYQRERFGISCIEILEGSLETFAPVVAKLAGK